jgi:dolichol-phosphate mannosyltransferase
MTSAQVIWGSPIEIVLPVHNEGASIEGTLREFYRKIAVDSKIPIRFVICEDGSTDDTAKVLNTLSEELPIHLISDPIRKGYSRAVIDGMRATNSDWVALMDSDGQCDPVDFTKLLAMREGADLVMGWRNPRRDRWARKLISALFGLVYRATFSVNVRDPSCPYLVVRRPGLQRILSGNVGVLKQAFLWEFVARASALGLRIVETPVNHRRRASGTTQVYRPVKLPFIAVEHLLGLCKLKRELNVF